MPTFINDKNRLYATDRKHSLANQLEIAANLHRRMGLPFLPQTLHSKFVKGYTTVMQLLGVYGSGAIILVMLVWILLALSTSAVSTGQIPWAFVTIGVAGYVLYMNVKTDFFLQFRLRQQYPLITWETLARLVSQGTITGGQIASVDRAGTTQTIHYLFSIPEQPGRVAGQFVTSANKSFASGDDIAILYLDKEIHTLL